MKLHRQLLICAVLVSTSAAPVFAATAPGIAQNAVRQNIAGIDLVVVKTGVKDVVTIRGTLAAGDSRSPDTNVALADLV